ncbi:uncharacterized protein [Anoplolepis gracilipes]|uniref:uncharacterized protein n=1 Tax=Anoplolepis gracilipes TaxID=354296 RepID=UPI003BA3ABFD
MDKEKEVKFLGKKQTKRNIQKQVHELLNELNWNETKSTTHSVIDSHLELNLNIDEDLGFSLNFRNNETKSSMSHSIIDSHLELGSDQDLDFEIFPELYITEKHDFSENETLSDDFLNKLRNWALTHNITLSALDELLSLLRQFHYDISVPLSGRSLLYTPKTTNSIDLQSGKFTYFGMRKQLYLLLKEESCSKIIDLDFNIDGLPLFKSNNIVVWPILCRLLSLTSLNKPFIVGLFTGKGKPELLDCYLQDLIHELNDDILKNSIEIDHKLFQIRIRSLICDAPARAFLKCCVGHNSRHGCEKCDIEGKYINKMIFPCKSGQLRTKETFTKQVQEEHHKGRSPLLNLNLDLVNQFPLDPMHLVYLGIMKKLLILWVSKGKPSFKLSGRAINNLSNRLILLSSYIVHEFPRKCRAISDLNRWKANEFRLFLLYVGPVSLINILPKQLYNHFLMFHVGITILCNDNHIFEHIDFAEEVLYNFVKYFEKSYGKEEVTYNLHSLIHLVTDVRNLGNLNTINCFPFENYLGKLKKLVRSSANPHAQLCRRISELFNYSKTELPITKLEPKQKHFEGPTLRDKTDLILQYKKLKTPTCVLTIFSPDNCVSIQGDIIVQIVNILCLKDQFYSIICRRFLKVSEFYDYPCSSKLLNIFKVSHISPDIEEFPFISVKYKNILLPAYEKGTYIVFPLLHEL